MKTTNSTTPLERLVGPLGECLTPEAAQRLLALKGDRKLQARVDYLARRCNRRLLTPDERAEYGTYVSFGTFVANLKSKARQLLAGSTASRQESSALAMGSAASQPPSSAIDNPADLF